MSSRLHDRIDSAHDWRDCWEWNGSRTPRGYGKLYRKGSPRKHPKYDYAHRLAYEEHYGPIPDGLIVRHRCDNPPCCNPYHLVCGTYRDNSQDAILRGRHHVKPGALNFNSKLTDEDVLAIRKDRRKLAEIAQDYDVSAALVSLIRHRKRWTHLP